MRKNQSLQKSFSLITAMTLVVVTLFGLGCADRNRNSGNPSLAVGNRWWNGGYNYGQPGFGGFGVVNGVAAGIETGGRAMLILQFATQSNSSSVYGPAMVDGELQVYQPLVCLNGNGMRTGIYQLYPANGAAASLAVDFASNIALIAQGPGGQALITIPYARIFTTQVCGFSGMMGSMNIEQVNGMLCGLATGFTDQTSYNYCGF